ncbi:MAG: DUF6057 family protein [Prevotella sp.]|nr:DUF6057 family protein [Prevotella sp.]
MYLSGRKGKGGQSAHKQEAYQHWLPIALLLLASVACFVFFQFWYPYHFFYQEQSQLFLWSADYLSTYFEHNGWLAQMAGDFLTQFYYYLYAGAAILSLCILLLGLLVYDALRRFSLPRWAAVTVALVVMTFAAVVNFYHGNRLPVTIALLGWAFVVWLLAWIHRPIISFLPKSWQQRMLTKSVATIVVALVLMGLAYPLFGIPQVKHLTAPDFVLEQDFAVDSEYYFGNHEKVIQMVEGAERRTQEMLFFYNLVQAQRGELPDHLLQFTPNQLGTFYQIGPETPLIIIRNMNELYWMLGDMTFTERAAMMTNVFSPDNRNVRMMRRLAECNLVSGDSLAAEKYLRILDRTLVYRSWAQHMRKNEQQLFAAKRQMVNHHDTITISDNAHFLMMQLLDANPQNTIALDYILCSDLLLKDITNFKRDYDRYCMPSDSLTTPADTTVTRPQRMPRLKKLYQEALCIWLAGSKASEEEWQRYIRRHDVLEQFMAYNQQRGSSRFRNTYWYYFDKVKAPKP